jgi:2-amino-4-hydroxy-6-hydroxymethyldihydropteridine diphosphokinase
VETPTDTAVVGLGSNLGDREGQLLGAIARIDRTPGCHVTAVSRVYESDAVGPPQPRFLNGAVRVDTSLAPERLLDALLEIERALGRVRRERWGPRPIDLDILWIASGPIATGRLVVPHPHLAERAFAMAPLLDVAPDLAPIYRPLLALLGTIELFSPPKYHPDGHG